MRTCPTCGREVAKTDAACPSCGQRFTSLGIGATVAILAILLLIIAALAMGVVWVFRMRFHS
jgi:hypothetical protein